MEGATFDGNRPLFQEPPDDLGPDSNHGFLLGGMAAYDEFQVAKSYRQAGDAVIDAALKDADLSYEWVYPAFFLYRHALELYLKLIVRPTKPTHSLSKLVKSFKNIVRRELRLDIPSWALDRLKEIAEIDPESTSFRYFEVLPTNKMACRGEWWVEFGHLKQLMNCLFDGIERAHWMRQKH